jgi:hypothetical protein
LICPGCGGEHAASERFCEACGLPLIHAGSEQFEEPGRASTRLVARKVDPRYVEGELVKAIGARNRTEAEFLQGLLLEEGIPSMLRRSRGFDVPDFLAAGPRDVLVPQAGLGAAREVLLQSELIDDEPVSPSSQVSWEVLAFVLGGFALVALVVELALLI